MGQLLDLLGPLGCAAMMGIAAILIARASPRPAPPPDPEVARLREAVARLREARNAPADD